MPVHFRPQLPFERLYETTERALAFSAETPEAWREWRERARAKLLELLVLPTDRTPLEPELLEQHQREGYRLEKWLLQTQPYVSMPVYVLIPDSLAGPAPVILASHGHGFGVADIVGELHMHRERQTEYITRLNYDYARQAALRGYVVIAPEQHGFGERREPELIAEDPGASSCRQAGLWAAMLGRTVLGVRVWDAMRCLDYLETRLEADMTRVGMIGLSGGGMVALYTSALEDRLSASVVSGYFCQFQRSILAMFHCDCNYVPGILQWFECADLAGMIAPKPVLFEAGDQDPIFPLEGVREAYAVAERVYKLLGIEDRLELDVFPGEHQWHGERSWEFLRKWVVGD